MSFYLSALSEDVTVALEVVAWSSGTETQFLFESPVPPESSLLLTYLHPFSGAAIQLLRGIQSGDVGL